MPSPTGSPQAWLSQEGARALTEAALKVYRRYQLEFVERYNLCPYAKTAREQGNVREVVITTTGLEPAVSDAIHGLATDVTVEIGLLICPLARMDRVAWERWVSALITRDTQHYPPGQVPFAMAAFHPYAEVNQQSAQSLVPFIRRTPDPTIQLVRLSALERVRKGFDDGTVFVDPSELDFSAALPHAKPSLRSKICNANERSLRSAGFETADGLLTDILRERTQLYQALGIDLGK